MRSASVILAVSLLWLALALPAAAHVEFGRPDFSNYLAPFGRGTCDWWTAAWLHACPGAQAETGWPAPSAVPAAPVVKVKKGRAAPGK